MTLTRAIAQIRSVQNEVIGLAEFTQQPDAVSIQLQVTQLPPGRLGLTITQVGRCEPPDFASAGSALNPTNITPKPSGENQPLGQLPDLEVRETGPTSAQIRAPGLRLSGGPNSLFDPDGSALVIHVPQGQEGGQAPGGQRLACGVIQQA